MMFRFSERTGGVLAVAYQTAKAYQTNYIGTEHLLAGILTEGRGLASDVLSRFGLEMEQVQAAIMQLTSQQPQETEIDEQLQADKIMAMFTPRTRRVMEMAAYEAQSHKQNVLEPEHLLMGIIREGESVAVRIIKAAQIDMRTLYAALSGALSGESEQPDGNDRIGEDPDIAEINQNLSGQDEESRDKTGKNRNKTPVLDKYGRDLTRLASENRFDPIIGRDEEISRVMQILCRRTKNNPVLIGEPGVGKTAIAEGLAQRMVKGEMPELLQGKRLVADRKSVV